MVDDEFEPPQGENYQKMREDVGGYGEDFESEDGGDADILEINSDSGSSIGDGSLDFEGDIITKTNDLGFAFDQSQRMYAEEEFETDQD